jgi:lipopolysaccharide transport system ATP-binding protein
MAIIEIQDISKRYRRSRPEGTTLTTLSETLANTIKRPLRLFQRVAARPSEEDFFWALRNVNLQIEQGDVVGIIGRNGAGKSTLLKVLSHITEPTSGRVVLRGRMASLLEVGTGFHPELTGRENIYLNGAILGMKKQEIRSKFDEIVAFSEIDQFLDTPVKRYSSGMYVRLAFAVAAHLNPEILVVDEVLAVGDFAFQRKCLGKMTEVSRNGRTILFVSHNMAAVENLCTRGVVLEHGQVVFDGTSGEAIQQYLHAQGPGADGTSEIADLSDATRSSSKYRRLMSTLQMSTVDGLPVGGGIQIGAPLALRIAFRLDRPGSLAVGVGIENLFGQRIFSAHTMFSPDFPENSSEGDYVVTCRIPSLTLCAGEYRLTLGLAIGGVVVDHIEDAYRLTIIASDYYGTGKPPNKGVVVIAHDWALEESGVPCLHATTD